MINLMQTKKKSKIFYIYALLIFLCIGALFSYQQARTKNAVSSFFKTYNISRDDIKYNDVSTSFLGNNLIFYNVIIKDLSATHSIEKLIISRQQSSLKIKLIGMSIDVINSLRRSHNIHILNALNEYKPVVDIFQKPLQSLALANVDTIKFNADITITPMQKESFIKGRILAHKLFDFHFKMKTLDNEFIKQKLHHLFYTTVKPVSIYVKDNGFFNKYDSYLNSLGLKESSTERSFFQKESFFNEKNDSEIEIDLRGFYKLKQN